MRLGSLAMLSTPLLIAVTGCLVPPTGGNNNDSGVLPCSEGETRCTGANVFETCEEGSFVTTQACDPLVCNDSLGCVACNPDFPTVCQPDGVHECLPDGTIGSLQLACPEEACVDGVCLDPCILAAAGKSYIGCEYWAVDLDNVVEERSLPDENGNCTEIGTTLLDPTWLCYTYEEYMGNWAWVEHQTCDYDYNCPGYTWDTECRNVGARCVLDGKAASFAIVVANPDDENSVDVTVSVAAGASYTTTVAPGAIEAIFPQQVGLPNQFTAWAGIQANAYHIVSTRPIVAYQFNPLDTILFSNDGTILLPVSTYGTEYIALSYDSYVWHPSFMSIVATEDGTTTVTVTTTAPTREGLDVPAGPAGTYTYTLARGEVLTIESVGPPEVENDLTGSRVTADKPVGVFGGHQGALIGDPGGMSGCCADHLEVQLPPTNAWGWHYVVARSVKRHNDENHDLLRILAQKDNTEVTFSNMSLSCPTLAAGEYCDVYVADDVEIESTEPILVGHYLTANGGGDGDPSMAFAVPVEQYLDEYTFLTPPLYGMNYVSISARLTDTVLVDGIDVSGNLVPVGDGEFGAIRVELVEGRHTLECAQRCGVMAYGWDPAVSYLFAAGLNVAQIVF